MTEQLVLTVLAEAARPRDDADWGSDRQIVAENAFFAAVERTVSPDAFEQLEGYCLKATERIDEALRLVREGRP